jgi:outer membrane protein assembly factor BamB
MAVALDTVLAGQRILGSGFGRGRDGVLYVGTIAGRIGESGHLLAVRVERGSLNVSDLGIPVAGEGIFALTADPGPQLIYGISYPSGKFFVFHVADHHVEIYPQTVPENSALGELQQLFLKPEDYLCRRLALDTTGRVYGSMPVNKLFRFDPSSSKLEVLPEEMPNAWGGRALGRVDSWAIASDGTLYGGNAGDGQLFRVDPSNGHVINLGKPGMMPRIYGLAFTRDGTLYGINGGNPGYAHLFRWDSARGFADLGNPVFLMTEPGIEQGILWRGSQIATVAASGDGRYVVMGEQKALSQLNGLPARP